MDAEHGQQRCFRYKKMPESAEELKKLLIEEDKPNDSPDVISLHRRNRIQGARDNVSQSQNVPSESQPQLPEPSNIPDMNGGIIVNVHNIIENNNKNHAIVNTSDRNAGESDETERKSAREEDSGNDTPPQEQCLPHQENDNTPVEERGVSYQPETPDPIDVSQEPERVPNDSVQMQPVADNDVLARPEGVPSVMEPMESSRHGIEQLNVYPPGGTVPMKNMSADSGAFVGTQPLKPDNDYTGNNDYTRVRDSRDADTSISQDESLNNNEVDEDDDAMSSQRVVGEHHTDEHVH
ncbi:type-2 histone deacetylase 1-like isoform X3 [Ruditapes philippinarum]|uniref:type-2 histone deacetylase 1-like isoform X3 n=1 Tax=Ruditapes philippinarum TaxID=129788 RepID=UPI00295B6EDB|nr:type-2 histone deacetylase 1-like isoform X3 [Ruditapes philippinarum]XP_060597424.1 type-2 histone deacetylase 1-like isoform X3 [Ruditapes philippinarum]XP_060597425.1 type-2 histone deacetylase 1-like isoform X3 [Ruditapes philippinarum]